MRKFAIIVPVKGNNPKGRLGAMFTSREKKQLQLSMLEDTLGALSGAKKLKQTYVVSSDGDILKFAERFGVGSIPEEGDEGVNEAVERAMSVLDGYDGWMIIPADLPLITSNDIRTVLTLVRMGSSVVISPSEDYSGTNLLLVSKKTPIRLHYDDDSFTKHVGEATRRGIRFSVYYSQNVGFDVDTSSDVHRYFGFGRRNSTMNFLERTLRRRSHVQNDIRERERRRPDGSP
ncbi:MAG: 2-phospho-L-lactate guanylyltransferase [Nitrososphaerota archaeon]|nr:2-phospho-L-lactate guanylyltransferase [Nitrososphaerota archaeon]